MNYKKALEIAKSGKAVTYVGLDGTRKWSVFSVCELEDGELTVAHPTDPKGPRIQAPKTGKFWQGEYY